MEGIMMTKEEFRGKRAQEAQEAQEAAITRSWALREDYEVWKNLPVSSGVKDPTAKGGWRRDGQTVLVCPKCGKRYLPYDHIWKMCPVCAANLAAQIEGLKNVPCRFCGEPGHYVEGARLVYDFDLPDVVEVKFCYKKWSQVTKYFATRKMGDEYPLWMEK